MKDAVLDHRSRTSPCTGRADSVLVIGALSFPCCVLSPRAGEVQR
jgi:hypothetical protein